MLFNFRKKKEEKINNLLKTIMVFVIYLIYTSIVTIVVSNFGLNNEILISFIADILFLVFILLIYKDKIKKDGDLYYKTKPFKRRLLKVLYWVVIIVAANILGSLLSILLIGTSSSENNVAVLGLPYIYKIFKTLIFSSIAEELVVKQSIRDVIDNNILFIIVSTLIYSSMNIMYTNLEGVALLANMIPYALFAIVTGVLYIKNKDNIYMVMVIKMLYTVIPLFIVLMGVGAWWY